MKRFKLIVAYDGTNYCGWQRQPKEDTIEGELNKALFRLTGENIQVIGASRTDAGVHACGNVAVFDSETSIPGERLLFALNSILPEDIRVMDSCQVSDTFHPRYCDTRKTYEYRIQTGRTLDPTARLYSHWIPYHLDVEAMNRAGQYLVGTHDFKSFCVAKTQVKTTVRTVTAIKVWQKDIVDGIEGSDSGKETDSPQNIVIRVEGEGFLYNMVRIISGTLFKVGLHAWAPEYVQDILAGCDRTLAGETLPAKGLFLKQIEYL
ncbi:MAG: tRNA pseudouridine(38-40) synthase TruA [Clostridiales bacterium]|nr:tRNA pseudouridine(38-40) synthase TruA [Clostridiales bacterium]